MPFKKATRLNLTGIAQSEPKMDYRMTGVRKSSAAQ